MSVQVELGSQLAAEASPLIERLVAEQVASRISNGDSSIWGEAAKAEASIRLGWVNSAETSQPLVNEILELRSTLASAGINRFVLCGMGGSSLAPEVITGAAGVELITLDATEPGQVQAATIDLHRTAVIVSSKSGSTVETDSQKRHFEAAFQASGINPVERIIIVTDPGSPLDVSSRAAGYKVFNADPNVGGRYSALTAFGLVPSGLAGADIQELLDGATSVAGLLANDSPANPAIKLAAALAATGSSQARDKFAILSPTSAPGLGDWVEQLVAESTGKEGQGRLPVVITATAPELSIHPTDLLVVRPEVEALVSSELSVAGGLGGLFLTWEYATAMLGYLLGINPFDQPDVESAKIAARALLDAPNQETTPDFVDNGIAVSVRNLQLSGTTAEAAISALLSTVKSDYSYISIQAYVSRPGYPQFVELRDALAGATGRPSTFGWGPRFLHSTGQYHKGGPKQGVYLQLLSDSEFDLPVPGREFSFGSLMKAQAAGDANVLAEAGNPVLTLRSADPLQLLNTLLRAIKK